MLTVEHPQETDGIGGLVHRRLERADSRSQISARRHAMMRRVDIVLVQFCLMMSGSHSYGL